MAVRVASECFTAWRTALKEYPGFRKNHYAQINETL